MDKEVKCECGKVLFDGIVLKSVAVGQFSNGFVNLKCRNCKRWAERIPQEIFLTIKEK